MLHFWVSLKHRFFVYLQDKKVVLTINEFYKQNSVFKYSGDRLGTLHLLLLLFFIQRLRVRVLGQFIVAIPVDL